MKFKMMSGEIMNSKANDILSQINKVIIGKDEVVQKVFMAILAKGHILLEDVPGVGKTTLALAFSKTLGLDYKRIQFTSDTMPSDITGFSIFDNDIKRLKYIEGPVITNILLADEINRTSGKTQSALLEVMEENQVTVDGFTHMLPQPFTVIATQNPIGSLGTQPLPSSQIDRFMIKLSMGYPDFKSQVNILKDRQKENPVDNIYPVINQKQIIDMQNEAENIFISDSIYEYITRLVEETRNCDMVDLGVSPRGALAVCRMAKSFAYIKNRDYVVPSDIYYIFSDVCSHRLVLNRKAKLSEVKAEDIIKEILENTEKPQILSKGDKI